MQCTQWQEAISARLDGELRGVDGRLLDAHLGGCASCQHYLATALELKALAMRRVEAPMPDVHAAVLKTSRAADRLRAWTMSRVLLAVVAVEIVIFSIPPLLGRDVAESVHQARHLGAFTLAYGVALLVVVARPARARSILPVAMVLAGSLVVTAVVDLFSGRVPLFDEVLHIPELLSVLLIWLVALPTLGPGWQRFGRRGDAAPLSLVQDERRAS